MTKRMFFFDFDDTLYSHATKRVPESARQSLLRLQAEGNSVVIATGREPGSLEFIRQSLNIPIEWMIALNGQLLYRNGEKVYERFITLPSIREICSIAAEHSFPCGGHYAGGSLVTRLDDRVRQVWQEFGSPPPHEIPDFEERYPLHQGHLYVTREEAEQYFSKQLQDYLTNWSHPTLMNLISRETGKSQGIAWLLKQNGISPENAYAFGDGFNDKDMLLAVGHGVAMGNASNDLKAVAEFVAPKPDENGIQKALQYYGIIS